MTVIKTCEKCCNAQAEKDSKYCKRCNEKKAAKKSDDVNTLLHKFGFHIS